MQRALKMTETLAYGYSSESSQRELSNEYQHHRVLDVFQKVLCPCAFDQNSHSIEMVNRRIPIEPVLRTLYFTEEWRKKCCWDFLRHPPLRLDRTCWCDLPEKVCIAGLCGSRPREWSCSEPDTRLLLLSQGSHSLSVIRSLTIQKRHSSCSPATSKQASK